MPKGSKVARIVENWAPKHRNVATAQMRSSKFPGHWKQLEHFSAALHTVTLQHVRYSILQYPSRISMSNVDVLAEDIRKFCKQLTIVLSGWLIHTMIGPTTCKWTNGFCSPHYLNQSLDEPSVQNPISKQ